MSVERDLVLVVGAGTMGVGIAQNLLAVGASVILADAQDAALERGVERIREGLTRQWRDRADADSLVADALRRLDPIGGIPDGCAAEVAIEAVPESIELKRPVLAAIDRGCQSATVIATNTSSLSITELASAVADPGRFIGMHFFNPVPRSSLIEIVMGTQTSATALTVTKDWALRLDKTAIVVRDSPGFATSRLGLAIGLEAIRMVEQGVASPEDIDLGMTLGYKHPIGPLRLTDLVGLDVRLGIAEHLAATLGPRFEAPQLLRDMVDRDHLGQKSGQGFYTWP